MAEFRLPAKARFTSLFIPFLLPAQFISRHPNRMYNEQPIDLSTRNVPCFASFLTVGIPGPTGNGNRNNYRCPSFDRVDGRGHWIRFDPSRFEYEFFYRCLKRRMRVIDIDYRFEVFVQSLQEDCFINLNCYRWRESKLESYIVCWRYKYLYDSTLVVEVRNEKIVRKGNVDTFSL